MYSKNDVYKFAVYLLKHIFQKRLSRAYQEWKKLKTIKSNQLIRLKSQKNISLQLSKTSNRNLWSNYKDTTIKRPNSTKLEKDNESPSNFGERLHKNAKEIELKKEEVRKLREPECSFTPKLSIGTEKWLLSRSKKELRDKFEEVAVVSGNSILQYTTYTPNVKKLLESKGFKQNTYVSSMKTDKNRTTKRSDRPMSQVSGFSDERENQEIYYY